MGKLIHSTALTVDGLADVRDWFVADGDHDRAALDLLHRAEAMLVGRKSYEGFAGFWPTTQGPWADRINPMPKYVASRTLEGPLDWNATLLEGDAVHAVPRLKQELDGDLFMSGCGELARELLGHGLIDELYFWVHPALAGPGTRPFGDEKTVRLRLLDATGFESGVALLRYEPVRRG
jgi:dihydrofolate reductase